LVFGLALVIRENKNIFNRKYSNNYKDNALFYYLAGLIEGDGHFNVPKGLKDSLGKSTSAKIEVVFVLKDTPSAEFMQKIFGGNIYRNSNKNNIR
jgi:hypothetical protein